LRAISSPDSRTLSISTPGWLLPVAVCPAAIRFLPDRYGGLLIRAWDSLTGASHGTQLPLASSRPRSPTRRQATQRWDDLDFQEVTSDQATPPFARRSAPLMMHSPFDRVQRRCFERGPRARCQGGCGCCRRRRSCRAEVGGIDGLGQPFMRRRKYASTAAAIAHNREVSHRPAWTLYAAPASAVPECQQSRRASAGVNITSSAFQAQQRADGQRSGFGINSDCLRHANPRCRAASVAVAVIVLGMCPGRKYRWVQKLHGSTCAICRATGCPRARSGRADHNRRSRLRTVPS